MTILVTGGAGFIGSHLVESLRNDSNERVVALDNFNNQYDPQLKRQTAATLTADSRVTLIEGDYCDKDLVLKLLRRFEVTAVCHLGAAPGVPRSVEEPVSTVENNVLGTLELLEAVRQHRVRRFIFASSSTVYGAGAAAPFVEDAPLGTPLSPYGASKRAAELLGLTYHRLHGIPFVSLRFFNVYGPRLRPELALAVFTGKILAGEPLPLFGDGSVLRDFTHVSDICRGIRTALTAGPAVGQCINLGNDRPIPILRLVELIEEAAGCKARIDYRPARAEDMPVTHADLDKARRLLSFEPQVPIERGVTEYVQWYRCQLEKACAQQV